MSLGEILPAHVAGQRQHRHAGRQQRPLDGLLEQPGQLLGARDRAAEDRHVAEQRVVVDLLEEVAAQLGERHLAAQREHRRVRLLGVVEAVEQVDRAGADRAHADAERARELRLRGRGERAGLLVADADPLHPVLAADGVGDRVERVTDDAPDRRHALAGERADDALGDVGHAIANESGFARAQSAAQKSGGSASSSPGSSQWYSSA